MTKLDASRRDFLKTAALATAGFSTLTAATATAAITTGSALATADAVIWVNLVGGPSQVDTFDPKPTAPATVRGPFRPIPTRTPGVQVSELFPKLAAISEQFSLIRSLHHTAPPVHEAGFQLLQTGKLVGDGPAWPHLGVVVGYLLGERNGCPAWQIAGGRDVDTGMVASRGFSGGFLTSSPLIPLAETEEADNWANVSCRQIQNGARFLTINMFPTVFDAPSWDCHAAGGSLHTTLSDYRDTVAPMFDALFSQLIQHLESRGMLARTLVVATGEFGRTPHLNANGGRDHWARCWSALLAGGGVQGGRVIGASDRFGGEPAERPVTPPELVATVYHALGITSATTIPGPEGDPVRVVDAEPVRELF
ncbi:MAG: DUF1501 domain-containing protein [Bacteroidales bacterium]|nr:DUF1501 domain-containing protein [Bacteroidales bacterium]